ncbi:fibronectin type III domain-containing protein, partial [Emticicia sp. 17c]|uniref:fibronectin type III domain-containing protein n=1 Tax=Emticicia sp. 17c TaxID=3127704 RepID=UPI00301D3FC5
MILTWDKNKLHESYQVVYKDINKVERVVLINKNTVTLTDLDPNELYQYSIVAVRNNLRSDPATGELTSSLCRGLIERPTTRIVEGTTITLTASSFCRTVVNWIGDDVSTNQRSIVISPSETTTYELNCIVESKNGEARTCNDKIEIKVDKKCTDVVARATTYDITQG